VNNWIAANGYVGVSPPRYVHELANSVTYSLKVMQPAKIIVGKWRMRRLIATCQKVAAASYAAVADVDSYIAAAEAELLAATSRDEEDADDPATLADAVLDECNRILHRDMSAPAGLRTGLVDVDRIVGSLEAGDLVIVAAHSGVGKTSMALQMATSIASTCRIDNLNSDVYVASQEMTKAQIARRALSGIIRLDTRLISAGQLTEHHVSQIAGLAEGISTGKIADFMYGITVDDRSSVTPSQLLRRAKKAKRKAERNGSRLALIVVDYLQLMDGSDGPKRNHERHEREMAYIAESLKNIAKKLGCVVIALAQLNQDARSEGRLPRGEDLAGCKAIRAPADKVLLIHNESALARRLEDRPESDEVTELPGEIVQIIIDKNRGGQEGIAPAMFFPSQSVFNDLTRESKDGYYRKRSEERAARAAQQEERKASRSKGGRR
jgi:replicative DNA helicase